MPPITTMISPRLGRASRNRRPTSPSGTRSSVPYPFRLAITPATAMSDRPSRIPGMYPATNKAATLTPPDASE